MRRLVFLLFVLTVTALNVPATELVVNGGFETGDFTGWTLSGNSTIPYMEVNQFVVLSGIWTAQLGSVGSDGFLSQFLNTIPGTTYTLSYLLENATPGDLM